MHGRRKRKRERETEANSNIASKETLECNAKRVSEWRKIELLIGKVAAVILFFKFFCCSKGLLSHMLFTYMCNGCDFNINIFASFTYIIMHNTREILHLRHSLSLEIKFKKKWANIFCNLFAYCKERKRKDKIVKSFVVVVTHIIIYWFTTSLS